MELNVKLQVFEGPLDLLLHLLEKNKVNIYDIPIAEITDQYLEYVALMRQQIIPPGESSAQPTNLGMSVDVEPAQNASPAAAQAVDNVQNISSDAMQAVDNAQNILSDAMQPVDNAQNISSDAMQPLDNMQSKSPDPAQPMDADTRVHAMDLMSEFMLMAATLLEIKARMLLPPDPDASEEEEDPRADLVARLLEYKMYKCMAAELKDRQIEASHTLYKPPTIPEEVLAYEEPVNLDELFSGVTLARLNAIFQDVMKKKDQRVDPIRSKFGKIQKEEVSLEQRTAELKTYAASHAKFSFRGLLEGQNGKDEVIVTFLAILELMRTGTITITQESLFADIYIESKITQEA